MPYDSIAELPESVRNVLPKDAQEIYKGAFNGAHEQYDDESRAHATAWAAVKKKYEKGDDGTWHKRD